jgi:hypothetical protein
MSSRSCSGGRQARRAPESVIGTMSRSVVGAGGYRTTVELADRGGGGAQAHGGTAPGHRAAEGQQAPTHSAARVRPRRSERPRMRVTSAAVDAQHGDVQEDLGRSCRRPVTGTRRPTMPARRPAHSPSPRAGAPRSGFRFRIPERCRGRMSLGSGRVLASVAARRCSNTGGHRRATMSACLRHRWRCLFRMERSGISGRRIEVNRIVEAIDLPAEQSSSRHRNIIKQAIWIARTQAGRAAARPGTCRHDRGRRE